MEFRVKGGEMFSLVNPVCFNYKQSHGVFYGAQSRMHVQSPVNIAIEFRLVFGEFVRTPCDRNLHETKGLLVYHRSSFYGRALLIFSDACFNERMEIGLWTNLLRERGIQRILISKGIRLCNELPFRPKPCKACASSREVVEIIGNCACTSGMWFDVDWFMSRNEAEKYSKFRPFATRAKLITRIRIKYQEYSLST